MFFINLDMSEVEDLFGMEEVASAELKKAAAQLAVATKAHIIEEANHKLHTRRGMFIEGLSHFPIDDTTWVINLDASARWIDEGMPEHNMLDDLLKSKKAKRAADGSTYIVVPFQLNKAKQNLTPAQQTLLATVKAEMAKVGTTPNQMEMDPTGKPKLGLVRSLDIMKAPNSTNSNPLGRGTGGVAQGPTGVPLLQGVRVYQKEFKDKSGKTQMGRFVMTFRVASSKQRDAKPPTSTAPWKKKQGADKPQGRWQHPGVEATNLMEDGLKWAIEEWERKIAPAVIGRLIAKLG
jgi:hypothetical protein